MTEVSDLPANWARTTIECVAEYVQRGKSPKYAEYSDLPVVNQKCIRWHGVEKDFVKFVHESQIPKWDDVRYLRIGDLLWNSTGTGTIGRACLYKNEFEKAVVDSHVTIVRAEQCAIVPEYLKFFVSSPLVQENFKEMQSGSTNQVELSRAAILEKEIPLAPFNEQRRIVDKIETLFAQLDKGEEALRAVQTLLGRYRQSVLKAAVTGQLTTDWRAENTAGEWQDTELGQLTEFLTSGSRGWAKYYAPSGVLFIRAQNLKHDRLDLDDAVFVSLPKKSEGTRTLVRRGDLLITITGANVTKTALVTADLEEAYVSQHVGLLRLTDRAEPEFVYWFLVAKAGGRKQLEKFAYGAGKPGLNLANIRDVKLALPSLPEQKEIVVRVGAAMNRISTMARRCEFELARSAALRQSVLNDAFAGRLVPQDPTDEPAEDLLARIKADRAETPKRARRKVSV